MKLQGCSLLLEGAQRAASNNWASCSCGTGRSAAYARGLQRLAKQFVDRMFRRERASTRSSGVLEDIVRIPRLILLVTLNGCQPAGVDAGKGRVQATTCRIRQLR